MTANGNRAEFDTYLDAYKKANPQSTSIEALDFEAAKSYYFAQDYQKAISRLQPLVAKNNESNYYDEASYYIADSYYRLNQIPAALKAFEVLVKNPNNTYYTRSLTRVASLELAQGNPTAALKYFNLLKSNSRSARERNDAYLGLMEAHFMAKKYDSTSYYAKQIVEAGGGSFGVQGKANLYLGKASLMQDKLDDAMDHFINTTNLGKDENGAEAQYLMAKILYQKKDYRQSLQTLYSLNNSYSNYPLWLGRSFLLIADNFIELKEYFQADATLTSLIEKSPIEEIKQAGIKKKSELQKLQAGSNNDSKAKKDSIK
jgi:TolA-binding protein